MTTKHMDRISPDEALRRLTERRTVADADEVPEYEDKVFVIFDHGDDTYYIGPRPDDEFEWSKDHDAAFEFKTMDEARRAAREEVDPAGWLAIEIQKRS